ncbi:ABC transporter substrate-binding protein [Lampropedia puyangensis]|nr:ABC transporter substrate-binding protein [Lampropedia puyangensis]
MTTRSNFLRGLTRIALTTSLFSSFGLGSLAAHAQVLQQPIKINVMPFLDAGPLLLADKNGIFKKHGLEATISVASSGATVVPTVLSGQFDVGYANAISSLQAIDNGLPLQLVHATYSHPSDPSKDPYRIWVKKDGKFTDPKQLADANIGTLSVKNIAEWSTLKSLENLGIEDLSKVRWTKVNGEDAYDAVKNGQIDAVWLYEPLGAAAKQAGLVPLLSANSGSIPGAVSGYYNTSRNFAQKNPDVLKRFNAALDEANLYASQHTDEVRAAVIEKFNFNPELVNAADLNLYTNDLAADKLRIIGDDLVRYKLIRQAPDLDSVFWKPSN